MFSVAVTGTGIIKVLPANSLRARVRRLRRDRDGHAVSRKLTQTGLTHCLGALKPLPPPAARDHDSMPRRAYETARLHRDQCAGSGSGRLFAFSF